MDKLKCTPSQDSIHTFLDVSRVAETKGRDSSVKLAVSLTNLRRVDSRVDCGRAAGDAAT